MMRLSNSSNPASVVKNWQASRQQAPSQKVKPAVDYDKAVERFQDDFSFVSSFDDTGFDKNREPGEVDIGGRGYLRSTDDGFEIGRTRSTPKSNGRGSYDGAFNQYSYNEKSGTLTVTQLVGAQRGTDGVPNSTPTQERYTLDTINGTIADHSFIRTDTNQAVRG